MKTIEDIITALKDRNITTVAENIGIHRQTLYDISARKRPSINFSTYKKLVDYLFPEEKN